MNFDQLDGIVFISWIYNRRSIQHLVFTIPLASLRSFGLYIPFLSPLSLLQFVFVLFVFVFVYGPNFFYVMDYRQTIASRFFSFCRSKDKKDFGISQELRNNEWFPFDVQETLIRIISLTYGLKGIAETHI